MVTFINTDYDVRLIGTDWGVNRRKHVIDMHAERDRCMQHVFASDLIQAQLHFMNGKLLRIFDHEISQ